MPAAIIVRVLPDPAIVAIAVAAAFVLSVYLVVGRQSKPRWTSWLAVADILVAAALVGPRFAAAFAAVWLVVHALPVPGRLGAGRTVRFFEERLVLSLIAVAVAVPLLAFPTVPGWIFLGPRFANAGWLLVVYAGAVLLRPLVASSLDRLRAEGSARPVVSLVLGMVMLEAGLIIAFGRSPAAVAVAAFVVSGVAFGAVSLKERGLRPSADTPDAGPTIWGLPPANIVMGLTAIALAIRLLVDRGLWLDEAISISQAQLPFGQMLEQLRYGDIHPPLYPALLWLTVRAFGTSEVVVRLPSIIAGTLLIPLLYAAGREMYSRRAGVMAATLGTFAPLLVWYSQEARMYSLLLIFAVSSLWFQVRALRRGRPIDWIAFGACCALMLWTHYLAVLQLTVQLAALGVMSFRRYRAGQDMGPLLRGIGLASVVLLVLVAPLAPFMRLQLASSGQLEALGLPSRNPGLDELSIYAVFANAVWALWGYHSESMMRQLVALWPLAMLFVLFLLGRGRPRVTWLLAGVSVVPVVVLFVLGLQLRDLFEVRYFITAVPALILIMSHLITRTGAARMATASMATIVLLSFGIALADQQVSHANPRRFDFGGALSYVDERADKGDVVLYAPRYMKSLIDYYVPGAQTQALMRGPAPPEARRVFVVISWSLLDRREPKAELESLIRTTAQGRRLVDEVRRQHIEVQVYGS